MVELETGVRLDSTRIFNLITAGKSEVQVRSVDTCISSGGLCRVCIAASNPRIVVPAVGLFHKVRPTVTLDCSQLIIYSGNDSLELPYAGLNFARYDRGLW